MPAPRLPDELIQAVAHRDEGAILEATPVAGGFWNATWRLRCAGRSLIGKRYPAAPNGIYRIEAAGLRTLRTAGVRAPAAVHASDTALLLEDLGPSRPPTPDDWESWGRQLACLHLVAHQNFGWGHDTYLGRFLIDQRRTRSGVDYYVEQRFAPPLRKLAALPQVPVELVRGYERLIERFARDAPDHGPCLLHGDLWRGNLLATEAGAFLIDPSVHAGWPMEDLYMARVADGFPRCFHDAYREIRHLPADWDRDVAVWQAFQCAMILVDNVGQDLSWAVAWLDRICRQAGVR